MSLAMGNKLFIDKSVSVAVIYNIYIYIKLVSTQHASIFFFLFININIYKQEKYNRCIPRADQFYIYIYYI